MSSKDYAAPAVVLIGPPGVGKTTVGELVAGELGLPFADADALIEAAVGLSVPEIFAQQGEPAFRAAEADVITAALREFDGVLALGGGAGMTPAVADALVEYARRRGQVVLLNMAPSAASARISNGARPLLSISNDDDGANMAAAALAKWQALVDERMPTYRRLATATVETSEISAQQAASRVVDLLSHPNHVSPVRGASRLAASTHPVIPARGAAGDIPARGTARSLTSNGEAKVRVAPASPASRPYPVLIGRGITARIPNLLAPGVAKVLLIHPAPLAALAAPVATALENQGIAVVVHKVPDAEAQKAAQIAAECWAAAGKAGITRSDAIVGVGGGATTDLAGFIAATWLRGVQVVLVPTSLLGMVDAAVGGKTGINTAEGKNLVGAFHQPAAVVCDLDALNTLPPRDFAAGMAEVVKCGLIADHEILALIEGNAGALSPWQGATTPAPAWDVVRELVQRAVAVKARIAGEDPQEQGVREFLNYGHTLGHAIEHAEGFQWRHGEAISVGMVFVAEVARELGLLNDEEVRRHRSLLTALGLPTTYTGATLEQLAPAMSRDKKARGATQRFILLDGIGNPIRISDPDPAALATAFSKLH